MSSKDQQHVVLCHGLGQPELAAIGEHRWLQPYAECRSRRHASCASHHLTWTPERVCTLACTGPALPATVVSHLLTCCCSATERQLCVECSAKLPLFGHCSSIPWVQEKSKVRNWIVHTLHSPVERCYAVSLEGSICEGWLEGIHLSGQKLPVPHDISQGCVI